MADAAAAETLAQQLSELEVDDKVFIYSSMPARDDQLTASTSQARDTDSAYGDELFVPSSYRMSYHIRRGSKN